jgi:hypothetical protein
LAPSKTTFARTTAGISPTLFSVTKLAAACWGGRLCFLHAGAIIATHRHHGLAHGLWCSSRLSCLSNF